MNLTSHHIQILATSSEAGAQAQSHVDSVDNIFSKTHNLSWHLIITCFIKQKPQLESVPTSQQKYSLLSPQTGLKMPRKDFWFCFFSVLKLVHSYFTCLRRMLQLYFAVKLQKKVDTLSKHLIKKFLLSHHERRWKCPWHLISKMWFCLQKHGWKSPDISANIFSFDTTNPPENVPKCRHRFLVLTQQTKNKMSPYRGRSSGFHGWLRIDWIITFGWNIPLKP